ncbi:hypothetical protein C0991_005966 [Blastosporella zonata]|nr:hypothetical protein C0991_005966 [Blastosporella zonata]
MTEDAQPNERPANRKGSAVPVIHSIQANNRGRGTFQRGGYGTRYYQRSLNRPQTGLYHFTSHNQQHNYLSNGSLHFHEPRNAKRKRTDHEPGSHSRSETTDPSILSVSKPHTKRRIWQDRPESLELLIDLPPQCRKGAPNSNRLRKNWEAQQIAELSIEMGAPLRCVGYIKDAARFVIDDTPNRLREKSSGNSSNSEMPQPGEIVSPIQGYRPHVNF